MIAVRGEVDHVQLCPRNAKHPGTPSAAHLALLVWWQAMDSGNELMGRTLKAQRDRLRKVTVGCLVRGRSYAIAGCLSMSITDHAFGSTRRGVPRCQAYGFSPSHLTTWDDIGGFKFAFQCRPGVLREAVTVPA